MKKIVYFTLQTRCFYMSMLAVCYALHLGIMWYLMQNLPSYKGRYCWHSAVGSKAYLCENSRVHMHK